MPNRVTVVRNVSNLMCALKPVPTSSPVCRPFCTTLTSELPGRKPRSLKSVCVGSSLRSPVNVLADRLTSASNEPVIGAALPSDFSAVDPVMPKEYLMPPPGGVVGGGVVPGGVVTGGVVAGGVVAGGVVGGGVVGGGVVPPPPAMVIVARV